MTGRQRILSILARQGVDRPAWTTLVDDCTRAPMPEDVRSLHPIDFYRSIGCDILQFGNYGLPREDVVPLPYVSAADDVTGQRDVDDQGITTVTRQTPHGRLVATSRDGHPVKYPVETPDDLRVLRHMIESTTTRPRDDHEAAYARIDARLGDGGVFLPTTQASPVQHLLEYEMGVANFYYLLDDCRAEMETLLAAMHRVRCAEYRILAERTPAPAVIPVENTSTAMISPEVYRAYSVPQLRDYADILHAKGKKIVLHMCGHLKALLSAIAETGLDATNATTPPPVGNTPFDDVLDLYGNDFPILGGMLDAAALHGPDVTPRDIHAYLDRLYTPRIRREPPGVVRAAHGLPTPLWKFECIGEWFASQAQHFAVS